MGKLLGSQLHLFLAGRSFGGNDANCHAVDPYPSPCKGCSPMGRPAYLAPKAGLVPEDTRDSSRPISCVLPDTTLPVGECKLGFRGHRPVFVRHLRISAVHILNGFDPQWTPGAFGAISFSLCRVAPAMRVTWMGH